MLKGLTTDTMGCMREAMRKGSIEYMKAEV
jgi:hypothetical protein